MASKPVPSPYEEKTLVSRERTLQQQTGRYVASKGTSVTAVQLVEKIRASLPIQGEVYSRTQKIRLS
jgi:hypothetical protein